MIIDFSVKKCSAGIVQNWVREDPEKAAICPLYKHACPLFNTDLFPATVKKQETETFNYYCGDSKRFSTEQAANDYRDKIIEYQNKLSYKSIEGNIVSDLFMNITPSLKPGDWYVKEEFWFLPDSYSKIELLKEYLLFRFPEYKEEVDKMILNSREGEFSYAVVLEESERGDYSSFQPNKKYIGLIFLDQLKDKLLSILPKK
jgi:hypothetical protein